ncbi:hypothetical protein CEXT_263851 [Caerostris extrusa]|uniref:HNH homing endonuclease n=1 Tax=Caerostris extrusa TaxID=172846 RepID=A0AAV4MV84_CAEEX|nr:hypothetical protein CEXT_263851 [Caerostris extrusa]
MMRARKFYESRRCKLKLDHCQNAALKLRAEGTHLSRVTSNHLLPNGSQHYMLVKNPIVLRDKNFERFSKRGGNRLDVSDLFSCHLFRKGKETSPRCEQEHSSARLVLGGWKSDEFAVSEQLRAL